MEEESTAAILAAATASVRVDDGATLGASLDEPEGDADDAPFADDDARPSEIRHQICF